MWVKIIFKSNLETKKRQKIEETAKQQISMGYWTKSDKDQLVNRTMTHELGHYVQRMLTHTHVEKVGESEVRSNNPIAYDTKVAEKMRADVKKICYTKFGVKPRSSEYGETSPFEWFAETFAELHTTKKLHIWLRLWIFI